MRRYQKTTTEKLTDKLSDHVDYVRSKYGVLGEAYGGLVVGGILGAVMGGGSGLFITTLPEAGLEFSLVDGLYNIGILASSFAVVGGIMLASFCAMNYDPNERKKRGVDFNQNKLRGK